MESPYPAAVNGASRAASPSAHNQSRIGKLAEVGDAVLEVDVHPWAGDRRGDAAGDRFDDPGSDARRRSRTAVEVALGLELGVAVDDETRATRPSSVASWREDGRRSPAPQPAGAHGVAELGLELGAERLAARAVDAHEQVGLKPVH